MHHTHHYRNNSFSQTSYPQDWDSSDNPMNQSYARPLQPQKTNSQSTSYIDKAFSLNNTPSSSDAFHNKLQSLREKFFGSSNDSQKINPPPLFTKQQHQQISYGTRTASPKIPTNQSLNNSKPHDQWTEETRGGSQNFNVQNHKQLLGFHRSSIDYYNEQRNMYMIEEEVVQKAPMRNSQTGYFHARSQSNPMIQEQSKYSEVINIFESSENTDPALEHDDYLNAQGYNRRTPPPLQVQDQMQENKSAKKFVTVSSGYSQSVVKEQKMINSFLQGKLAAMNNKPPAIQIPKGTVKKFAHVTSRINSGISPTKTHHTPTRIHQQPQHQPRPSKSPKRSPLPSPTQHRKKSPQKVKQPLYQGNTFGQYEWTDQDEGWIQYDPSNNNNNNNNNNKSSLNNVESVEVSPRNHRRKSMEEVHNMEKGCLNIVMALQNVTFKRMNSVFQSLKNVLYTLPEEEEQETSYNDGEEDQEASFGPSPTSNFNEKVKRSQERVLLEENQVLQGLIKINNLFINVKALVDRTKLSTFNQLQFHQQNFLIEEDSQNNVPRNHFYCQ